LTFITVGLSVNQGLDDFTFAIKSIFAQTYQDWKLIVVADGATGQVLEFANAIKDPRVRVISHLESKGLAVRLNEIAFEADTEYVARMDADDVMHPLRLELQVRYLRANPGVDILGGASVLIDENNLVLGKYAEPKLPQTQKGFLKSGVFLHPTTVLRREWAVKNPYDPNWIRTEDKELWLRTCMHSDFRKTADVALFYRLPRRLSVAKQALTSRYDRRLLAKYAAGEGLLVISSAYILKSALKQILFSVLVALHLQDLVMSQKYTKIGVEESQKYSSTLGLVSATKVPGWKDIQ
jgi:glycosyltransferase involved in cell wall biosynthesis